MFEYIKGKVAGVEPEYIVIETGGIGYLIYCPNPLSFQEEVTRSVKIYTYHHVREDAMALYGFRTREERTVFQQLLRVSGIGPKGALAVLAEGKAAKVVSAIENENEAYLTKFPGIGKKTARRIILDLKGKWPKQSFSAAEDSTETTSQALEEAQEALLALGFKEKEIRSVIKKLSGETLGADGYVKKALALLLKT